MMVHDPVPIAGGFAAKVTLVAHTVWSAPAAAVEGLGVNVITTSSLDDMQGGFVIVQRKV